MSDVIVECVPNFSEGRDRNKIDAIVAAFDSVDGADVIDVDPGEETNRTVVTIVGAPEAVKMAAFAGIKKAAELIDMRKQTGAHARHGATDVCPFVPVAGLTMGDCARLAAELGERVGDELGIPVYLYDQAAKRPERRSLAKVRAGEYEALPQKLGTTEWEPDFGPNRFDEAVAKTGVITIGAREFLIAYNVNLNSSLKAPADDIASEIREKGRALRRNQKSPYYTSGSVVNYSPKKGIFPNPYDEHIATSFEELEVYYRETLGRDLRSELIAADRDLDDLEGKNVIRPGLFRECRAVGWVIPEYRRAQISMNLTNYKVTSMHAVTDACRELARQRGLVITGCEIVGVVPFDAIFETGRHYLKSAGQSRGLPASDVVETAVQSLGLRDVADFDVAKSVLGMPSTDGELASMRVNDFADEVSRPTPAPGGGSIAALAGSLGASLAAMVANLSFSKKGLEDRRETLEQLAMQAQDLKDSLLRAIDEDTDAFNSVITAMRMPRDSDAQKKARLDAIQAGYKTATSVPLSTAELCLEALRLARQAAQLGMPASLTDAGVGALMARAGVLGAIDNVRINLAEISDAEWVAGVRGQLAALRDEANAIEQEVRGIVDQALDA
jgi:glutamate formiminotransferase / formiminotetrahydrofolate cyclodeaminase